MSRPQTISYHCSNLSVAEDPIKVGHDLLNLAPITPRYLTSAKWLRFSFRKPPSTTAILPGIVAGSPRDTFCKNDFWCVLANIADKFDWSYQSQSGQHVWWTWFSIRNPASHLNFANDCSRMLITISWCQDFIVIWRSATILHLKSQLQLLGLQNHHKCCRHWIPKKQCWRH